MIWKKIFAATAAGALLFSLAGFAWDWQADLEAVQGTAGKTSTQNKSQLSTAQNKVEEAMDKLARAESAHSVLTMDMEVEAFRLKLNANAVMDMVSFQSPVKVRSDVSLDLGILGDTQLEFYATRQGNGYQLYIKNEDGWKQQEAAASEIYKYNGQQMMQTFLEQIDDIQEVGTETLDSGTAYKYTGVIHSDGLQAILLDTGSLEVVAELFQNSMLKSFGSLLEQEDKISALMKKAEDMEVVIWIDARTGYPVKGTMDITEMLSDGYKQLYQTVVGGKSKSKGILSQIKIEKTEIVIECGEFNCAEEIVIPKAGNSSDGV
ncbi:MAG: hypothetical protein IJZ34_15480 [Lachnospiraceae bacterium]|nr:hypothetical protein [Lachnospiraceae bacterium]